MTERKTYVEERPWGKFEQFTHDEVSTVKILTVKDGGMLSIQYHHKREEFWRVIGGKGRIRAGDEWVDCKIGDEFYISKEMVHSAEGVGADLIIMEISFGKFEEDDIVRLEDKYGRP